MAVRLDTTKAYSHPANVDAFRRFSPDLQDQVIHGLQVGSPAEAEKLVAASGYVGAATQTRQDITLGKGAKTGPATSPPRGRKQSSSAAKAFHTIRPEAQVSCELGGQQKKLTGAALTRNLETMREKDPAAFKKFMTDNDVARSSDGTYRVQGSAIKAVSTRSRADSRNSSGSKKSGASASSAAGFTQGAGFPVAAGAMGFLAGGIPGAFIAGSSASAYRSVSSAGLTNGGMGVGMGVGTGVAAVGSAMGLSTDGMQFRLRAQMSSIAREARHDNMIGMFSTGMPIEDMIFMFLIYMGENYENKLKEKMEEAMISEKLEERQKRRTDEAKMTASMVEAGGALASSIPVYGAIVGMGTQVASAGIQQAASKLNQVEAAMNGGMKSGTQLANEVQMLMHKWKAMTELASNLIKAMHDMQMTPIRNIR